MPPTSPPVHVTPSGFAWTVRYANDPQPISGHPTLEEAVAAGERVAADDATELVVFNERWQIKARRSYISESA